MEIVMRLMTLNSGKTMWVFEVVRRGEVVKTFLTAEEAVAYI